MPDDIDDIDSRHLPVEPRGKAPTAPSQRVQLAYTSLAPKTISPEQLNQGQTLISEDEYLELIRNTELARNSQAASSKSPFYQTTASPSPAIDSITVTSTGGVSYLPKSPFSTDYKKYPSNRLQVQSTQTTPTPHQPVQLQQQPSQQQYIRQSPQPTQYAAQQADYYGDEQAGDPFSPAADKDVARVNVKKYHETFNKATKYDPARGQYHHEVVVKPTKKYTFKPSFQYTTSPQPQQYVSQQSQQSPVIQSQPLQQQQQHQQPLHYQSIQQIAQQEKPKVSYQSTPQPQRQYTPVHTHIHQPQQNHQPLYFVQDSNGAYNSYLAQTAPHYASSNGAERANQPIDVKPVAHVQPHQPAEYRVQYTHPTVTPARKYPSGKFASDSSDIVSQRFENQQQLKYELFDPNGEVSKDQPSIKLIQTPQHPAPQRPQFAERPQYADQHLYYKQKPKIQPQAHQYVHQPQVVRLQSPPPHHHHHHHPAPTPQTSQSSAAVSETVQIPPSRSTIFVSQGTGLQDPTSDPTSASNIQSEKQNVQQLQPHQSHGEQQQGRKPIPQLPITSPKKPITQAEFQALIDAGYKVQAIPVPVPVPVSAEKYKQLQLQQRQAPHHAPHLQPIHQHAQPVHQHVQPVHHHPGHQHHRQASTHYIRYHPQESSEEGILTSYLRPLIEYIGGGPSKD